MEATTATTPIEASTGSKTIADLLALAAQKHADKVAVREKVDGEWHDLTYAEVGEIVREIALGLIDLGIEAGERVSHPLQHAPRVELRDFAITSTGAVVVPIYPTNSPEECEWVVGNSEACAVICEDAEQVAKIVAVRERLPDLRHIIVIDPSGDVADAIPLDDLRERGRGGDPAELQARTRRRRPDDPFTFIYTSGTTGPPKGCVLTHGNYRTVLDMLRGASTSSSDDEVVYLYLPARPLLRAADPAARLRRRRDARLLRRRHAADRRRAGEVKPTYLPSVPRIFEKIYTLATAVAVPEDKAQLDKARRARRQGPRPAGPRRGGPRGAARHRSTEADEALFANVRAIFGGNLRQAVSGAAPIAHEILEFFYACRRARARGLRHDRDRDRGDVLHAREPPASAPSGARCPASRSRSPTTARS